MNGDQIVKEFVNSISSVPDINVNCSPISRRVFKLSGKLEGYIYLKSIAHKQYRWGITQNTVDKIKVEKVPWCIILLYESKYTGYLISSEEYDNRVAKNLWPFHQGDYKITEVKSLVGIPKFSTIEELLCLLCNQFAYSSSISYLIQKAIKETKPIHQKFSQFRGRESSSHKELKEYIAAHPDIIGLPKDAEFFIEYAFPSGDQVDVAFHLGNNRWAVVEIEIEGLIQNFVGLFQVIKYRALQEAVLKTQEIIGKVDGYLVSHSIPSEIKCLACILDIKTKEIVEDKLDATI